MKFESEYFEDAQDLVYAKDQAWENVKSRRDRLKTVREFTNMINTMSEKEAEESNRTEITNHGLTHRDMLTNESQFTSMVTVTNALLEVIVDTDNPEQDLVTGQRISQAINRMVIHSKNRFASFWRKVAGEIVIAGGGPVVFPEVYGWLPKLCPDMLFPPDAELDSDMIPYAFDPKELEVSDLRKLAKSVKGEKGSFVDVEKINAMLDYLKEAIRNQIDTTFSTDEEHSMSVRHLNAEKKISIPASWFYEVKQREDGSSYVSATLFTETVTGIVWSKKDLGAAQIIAYREEAYKDAAEWLHFVAVDSEVGGVKNISTLRGVAEMSYPSGLDMEELLNLTMEGDKIRAKPKVRMTETADADVVTQWSIIDDAFVPPGLEEFEFKGNSRGLMTPFSMLSQNSAGMTGGAVANTADGGELRQQAVERQRNSSMLQSNRVSEAYNHMESILETVVWRLLAGETKPGVEGYMETMAVRAFLKKYDIDFKKLAEKEYGKFKYIRIRAKRSIANGDRQQQVETADWLMNNLPNLEPLSRPLAIYTSLVLRLQDPDLAEALIKLPKAVVNAQKITAENEYDTISRRAALGQILPVAQDDIHQDHIPVHMLDMQAHVAAHAMRPWDMKDVLSFAGMVKHVGEHFTILLSNPATNPEAKVLLQDYQNITQSAQAIIREVEETQQQQDAAQQALTPKEKIDAELKAEALRLKALDMGVKVQTLEALKEDRDRRHDSSERGQYVKEINEQKRLDLDRLRIEKEKEQKKKQ